MHGLEWPPRYDPDYLPPEEQAHWFPDLETMDPRDRRERILVPKLRAQLQYCHERSAFYRARFDASPHGRVGELAT